jgi:hypothetical protein
MIGSQHYRAFISYYPIFRGRDELASGGGLTEFIRKTMEDSEMRRQQAEGLIGFMLGNLRKNSSRLVKMKSQGN